MNRWISRTLPLAIVFGALQGCAGEESGPLEFYEVVPTMDLDVERRNATTEVFGQSVDPNLVIATVGDATVIAADVAAYLRHFPTLTVEAAVEDLVDLRAARAMDFEADPADLHDARVRGRVIAWMRANLWEAADLSTPDPAAVDAMLDDPEQRVFFGTPELVNATHVLLYAEGEETQTPERAAAAEELARRVRAELASLDRPVQGFDLIQAARTTTPDDDPLLELFASVDAAGEPVAGQMMADAGMLFPETYAGPATWLGSDAVVPAFAAASFTAEMNQVVGPVQSEFGWHLILVESKTPAEMPSDEERVAMAEARIVQHQRGRRFQETVHGLIRQSQIVMFDENIALMSMSAEDRIQLEAGQRGARFN